MLLFIQTVHFTPVIRVYFKTSYVTVYPTFQRSKVRYLFISKHRMLLFILLQLAVQMFFHYFKTSYVTVYHKSAHISIGIPFISKHRMLLFIPAPVRPDDRPPAFQNIVCYCLSKQLVKKVGWDKTFQNIVCYCLSFVTAAMLFPPFVISKHRMLLFIKMAI